MFEMIDQETIRFKCTLSTEAAVGKWRPRLAKMGI
jgi:hypothetical protein